MVGRGQETIVKPCKDCALFRSRRCIVNPVLRKGITPGCANWRPSQPVCKTCGGQGTDPPTRRLVVVESPYAGDTMRHVAYALAAVRDCIERGEAPFASHLFYTQMLDDRNGKEREMGIECGLAWAGEAHATVVYTDLGISEGMEQGIEHACQCGRVIEYRRLEKWE